MGEQQELDSLGEIFEVVRQMAGFTGDIVMQYASGRAYREQKGVEAVVSYIRSGGRADSTLIWMEAAGEFEKRLMGARIPFAGFEITSERDEKNDGLCFSGQGQSGCQGCYSGHGDRS